MRPGSWGGVPQAFLGVCVCGGGGGGLQFPLPSCQMAQAPAGERAGALGSVRFVTTAIGADLARVKSGSGDVAAVTHKRRSLL